MLPNQPSRTARATGYLRAAHQLLERPPRLLEDPLALAVLGEGAADRIQAEAARYHSVEARALRSHVVLRSRFAEDRLAEAVRRGVAHYVVLGAGLDTFAFRQPDWARSIRIVEIDHPTTQQFKRAMLAKAGLELPANVTFIESDFNEASLLDDLNRHDVVCGRPTFFSWLGVTMYIPDASIDRTLQALGTFVSGSEIVLSFMPPPVAVPESSNEAAAKLAALANATGEPFVSYLQPAEVEHKLRRAGFPQVYLLAPEDAHTRYPACFSADFPPPRRTTIASGIV